MELHKVPEAAGKLGIAEKTLWAWIAARKLAVYRVGGRSVRIPQTEIDRLLTEGFAPAVDALAGKK